ncbi:MAG: DUF362 domain-containing protein [Nanoarchaeota archaeon]
MGEKEIVSIVKCIDYNPKRLKKVLEDSLKNINFDFKKINKVLIKPNLLGPHKPEEGVTTHPQLIEELCKILKEKKVKEIIIGESSAHSTDQALEKCGMNKLKKYAKIINFEKEPKKLFALEENQKILLPKILFEVDLIINFAKLKTHGLTQVTLCTKNLYGCVPGRLKEKLHKVYPGVKEFSALLNRIEMQIKPGLCFIDGIVGLEGDGPGASGVPIQSNVLLVGKNCGPIDIIASEIMGFKPESIYMNKNHNIKKSQIETIGNGKDIRLKFKKPSSSVISMFLWLNKFLPKSKIISDPEKCVRCGICVKKCPVKALSLQPHAICNHKICIKCLCCVEVCPHDAIHLEDAKIKKLISSAVLKFRKV